MTRGESAYYSGELIRQEEFITKARAMGYKGEVAPIEDDKWL
jgi:hypothetical protein